MLNRVDVGTIQPMPREDFAPLVHHANGNRLSVEADADGFHRGYFLMWKLVRKQCRRYAMSLPISTLVCGIESLKNLWQDLDIARNFSPMSDEEMSALLERIRVQAADGRHEWFKCTQYYDSKIHRDQHGLPPIGSVKGNDEL